MKRLSFLTGLGLRAESTPVVPKRVSNKDDFRQLLLATKWSWRNMDGDVADRECVFMPDDTFRHPHFIARFIITDLNTVELHKKGGKAVMTFNGDYAKFEAIDFQKHRVTGRRLSGNR